MYVLRKHQGLFLALEAWGQIVGEYVYFYEVRKQGSQREWRRVSYLTFNKEAVFTMGSIVERGLSEGGRCELEFKDEVEGA